MKYTKVILVRINVFNINYQKNVSVFYIFVPNRSFGQVVGNSPINFIFLKRFIKFSYVEVWFIDKFLNH